MRSVFDDVDVFVFTFGLTEAWVCSNSGTVFPTAPGTIAGQYDAEAYVFKNFRFDQVLADFERVREIISARNSGVQFLVTTSPVPLTATATDQHVEVATAYSKAVLRAVCGTLYEQYDDVDYFPSYEVITSQTARGGYYAQNLRSVSIRGVETAMSLFMQAHSGNELAVSSTGTAVNSRSSQGSYSKDDVVCEDALLEAFRNDPDHCHWHIACRITAARLGYRT